MEKWSCATRVNLVPLWVWRERPESASTKGWFPTWRHETPRTHSSGAGGWTICQAVKPQLTCRSAWVQPFRSVITGDEPAIIWHLLRVFFIVGISVGPCGLIQTHTENEGVINVGQSVFYIAPWYWGWPGERIPLHIIPFFITYCVKSWIV